MITLNIVTVLGFFYYTYLFIILMGMHVICACAGQRHVYGYLQAAACIRRLENKLQQLVLSFHHEGPRD